MKKFLFTLMFITTLFHILNAQFYKPRRGEVLTQPSISVLQLFNSGEIYQEEESFLLWNFGLMIRAFDTNSSATRFGFYLNSKNTTKLSDLRVDGFVLEAGRERHFARGENSSLYWAPVVGIGSNTKFNDFRFSGCANLGYDWYIIEKLFLGIETGIGLYAFNNPITFNINDELIDVYAFIGLHLKITANISFQYFHQNSNFK